MCRPSALRGYRVTAPGRAGAPGNTPKPLLTIVPLPEAGHTAVRAALHYGVAGRWIQDKTACGSVNILEAVDRVFRTGQTEVALHSGGWYVGPAE